jgi:hypothetical protein
MTIISMFEASACANRSDDNPVFNCICRGIASASSAYGCERVFCIDCIDCSETNECSKPIRWYEIELANLRKQLDWLVKSEEERGALKIPRKNN